MDALRASTVSITRGSDLGRKPQPSSRDGSLVGASTLDLHQTAAFRGHYRSVAPGPLRLSERRLRLKNRGVKE